MSETSTKQIIIGIFFWLVLIVSVLFFMRLCAQQESLPSIENSNDAPTTSELSWHLQMKHDKTIFSHLKKAGYKAHLFYSYADNNRITHLRIGPYTTRGQAKEKMRSIAEQFDVKPQIISTLSNNKGELNND